MSDVTWLAHDGFRPALYDPDQDPHYHGCTPYESLCYHVRDSELKDVPVSRLTMRLMAWQPMMLELGVRVAWARRGLAIVPGPMGPIEIEVLPVPGPNDYVRP